MLNTARKSTYIVILSFFSIVLFTSKPVVANVLEAIFEVQLGAGESDADVDIGEVLNLEIWLTLNNDGAGAPSYYAVQALSFFLDLDPVGNNIIMFNQDYIDDSGLSDTQINPPADNTPITGEFARSSLGGSSLFENGVSKRIGRFSITGQAEGIVNYKFGDDGKFRVWGLSISGIGGPDNYYPLPGTPVMIITVIPEPGTAWLIMAGWLAYRRRERRLDKIIE